ncbi:MAG: hypothetical protein VX189_06200, partial [Planctomycetota bacterium]|nr:hypothetical protein [Planctomycetota bacterium]
RRKIDFSEKNQFTEMQSSTVSPQRTVLQRSDQVSCRMQSIPLTMHHNALGGVLKTDALWQRLSFRTWKIGALGLGLKR